MPYFVIVFQQIQTEFRVYTVDKQFISESADGFPCGQIGQAARGDYPEYAIGLLVFGAVLGIPGYSCNTYPVACFVFEESGACVDVTGGQYGILVQRDCPFETCLKGKPASFVLSMGDAGIASQCDMGNICYGLQRFCIPVVVFGIIYQV